MKNVLFIPLAILAICIAGILLTEGNKETPTNDATPSEEIADNTIEVNTIESEIKVFDEQIEDYFNVDAETALEYKRMAIYPIKAGLQYLADNDKTGEYLNLKEALDNGAVQILERGGASSRNEGFSNPLLSNGNVLPEIEESQEAANYAYSSGASVNTLIIENTSNDTVYVMAGDVVQGGRQDRVLAQDMVIPPNSGVIEIPVFCVESNRWQYKESKRTNKKSAPVYAFTGYYNMTSNSIRHTVKYDKNQSEVWAEVGHVTAKHGARSSTNTYGALEESKGFVKARNEYLGYFSGAFDQHEDIIGILVVSGNKVLGCDIFATPELFEKQYELVLHSYVTDALTFGKPVNLDATAVQHYFDSEIENKYFANAKDESIEKETKYVFDDRIIHFTDLNVANN